MRIVLQVLHEFKSISKWIVYIESNYTCFYPGGVVGHFNMMLLEMGCKDSRLVTTKAG